MARSKQELDDIKPAEKDTPKGKKSSSKKPSVKSPEIRKKPKRKKLTKTEQERKRAKERIKRLQKRGYYIDPDDILNLDKANIHKIRKEYGKDTIYKKAIWIDKDTNEVIQGTTRRQMERREAARKAAETKARKKGQKSIMPREEDIIINNLLDVIDDMQSSVKTELRAIVESAVADNGKIQVAKAIKKNIEEIHSIINELAFYKSAKYINTLPVTRFARDIYERSLTSEELRRYGNDEDLSEIENRFNNDDWFLDEDDD